MPTSDTKEQFIAMQTGLNNTIPHTSWHLMNFMMCQIIGYAFRFAFETELADLKELVHPDSFCEMESDGKPGSIELELNLLETLDDPAVRIMLDSMERIISCRDMLALVNNLDLDNLLSDLLAIQLAENICNESNEVPRDMGGYKALLRGTTEFYYELVFQVYLCAEMFNTRTLHVITDETVERFCRQHGDIMLEELTADDKNVDLLYKLMIELNDNNDKLWQHIEKE